jgi:hypothetical protein
VSLVWLDFNDVFYRHVKKDCLVLFLCRRTKVIPMETVTNLTATGHDYNRIYVGKPKSPDDYDDEPTGYNPTNLELIDLRAALRFSHGTILATDNYGHLKFIDRGHSKLTAFDDEEYLWDWTIKTVDPTFKHMFWLSCGGGSVRFDASTRSLVLKFGEASFNEDTRPAIMMVEPWSGHLHVYNHHKSFDSVNGALDEKWLKLCDVNGSVVLIPPSAVLFENPNDIRAVTLTKLEFCTRDTNLTFSKRVMRIIHRVQREVLNRQVASHSDVHLPD